MSDKKGKDGEANVTAGVENIDAPIGDISRRKTFEDEIKIKAKKKAKETMEKLMAVEVSNE